jgi:hypothetical protein
VVSDYEALTGSISCAKRREIAVKLQIMEVRSRWYDHQQTLQMICTQCDLPADYVLDIVFFRHEPTLDSIRPWTQPSGSPQGVSIEIR